LGWLRACVAAAVAAMVSRRVLKNNLNDSLKLNRERLSRHQDDDEVKTNESKFDDAENAGDARNDRAQWRGRSAEKRVQLMDYLETVSSDATGECDRVMGKLSSSSRLGKKYDWEGGQEEDEEQGSLLGEDDSTFADMGEGDCSMPPSASLQQRSSSSGFSSGRRSVATARWPVPSSAASWRSTPARPGLGNTAR
jgi:hypothetical protein